MNKFIRFVRLYSYRFYNLILFLIVFGIILYLFPTQGKFQFEFQKGKPWMHNDLIADFDFAIKKSDAQLQQERDSVLQNFKPHFQYETTVFAEQLEEFKNRYEQLWNEFKSNNNTNSDLKLDSVLKDSIYNYSVNLMDFIYNKGIVLFADVIEKVNEGTSIIIVKNNVAEEYDVSEIFTPRLAYKFIKETNEKYYTIDKKKDAALLDFLTKLEINEYVQPNLTYDENLSNNVKNSMLDEISLSRGMVQAGERIISKGDLVNDYLYQMLESYRQEYEGIIGSSSSFRSILIGQIILIFIVLLGIYLFLLNFRYETLKSSRNTAFILLIFVLLVVLAMFSIKLNRNDLDLNLYVVPFVILPVLIRAFYDPRLALFIHISAILLIGFNAPNGFEFVFLQFIAGIIAIFSLKKMHRRQQFLITSLLVIFTYSITYFGIGMMQEGDIHKIELRNFIWFAISGGLIIIAYPLIFVFEKMFGFLSDVTLMELADTNQPLLRKLAQKAPGTFQHSLQVSNLAEEVIFKIGGNPLLIRTSALYHDIGKTDMPQYFIENQSQGKNPHDDIDFDESAEIIISHVEKGVKIARKNKLPKKVIDFIQTHHGTTKVQYFYRSFINKYPDQEVDVEHFTYPGPKPFTKETAVLMMADSVEAASRSLKSVSEQSINELVEKIIDSQIEQKQFEEADITFKDITTAKSIFKTKLKNIYHARIEYPEETKEAV